jgi:type IV pilus assembly protein PilY1
MIYRILKRMGTLLSAGFFISLLPFLPYTAHADDTDLFTISVRPNVLIILDNSNSMDEDFYGNAVGSFSPSGKSVQGKKVLIDLVNAYVNSMRIGLMSYRLPSSSQWHLHNSAYFASYEPKSYCPNPPAECLDYCRTDNAASQAVCQSTCGSQNSLFDATYRDEIITSSAIGTPKRNTYCGLIYPKTIRLPNPTDLTNYIYYKQALPYYDSADQGTEFDYAPAYNSNEYPPSYNSYRRYRSKTGTSDLEVGYSTLFSTVGFVPTDSDFALGYANFGRRLFSYHVGRTWFANNSPGNGYLHVAANDNNSADNAQLNALLAKLTSYESNETGYMACTNTANPNLCSYIVNAGLTPTAGALQSAFDYFTAASGYTSPIQYSCQKNYIIYVTDGLPSVNESGTTASAATLMPTVLNKLNSLRSFNFNVSGTSYTFDTKTYIVGVGLNPSDQILLDSMAVAGGTDVGGHAYYANDPSQLQVALARVFSNIIENAYCFSLASVTSTRAVDENYIYEASFNPLNNEPFWNGHLKKYMIESDGTVGSSAWDAGSVLQSTAAGTRNILTYKSGALTAFTPANVAPGDLGVSTTAERDAIVGFIRGEVGYNPDNPRKLGDIFHSNPVTVGSPNPYFFDISDYNGAFDLFRQGHPRTSANGKRIVTVGSNDGQLHAFRTSDGSEVWSFIPPNVLTRLQNIAHSTHPTLRSHQYFLDGAVTAADVWVGSGDSTHKSSTDWKTLLILGEGRGGSSTLWSSSSSCDSGFNSTYTTSYPYYCGYYSLDVTDTTNPAYMWRIDASASQAPYLGDPWSRVVIGRVRIGGNEKWVGVFGAGYNNGICGGSCDTRGKGFFVVDLSNGNILWSYTRADDTRINYSLPAHPAVVDTDNDGFVDTAYIGDMEGNVWRFKFCSASSPASCGTADWSGGLLFQRTGTVQPIYTTPTVTKDLLGGVWIYWGTGDKTNPSEYSSQNYFFAVKDTYPHSTYQLSDLDNISATLYVDATTKHGWYLPLPGGGEKVLDDSTILGGVAYFTTYTPVASSNPCAGAGTGKLYGIDYKTSAGVLVPSGGGGGTPTRSITLGVGIPTGPVVSFKPGGALPADIYVTQSGGTLSSGGSTPVTTQRVDFDPPTVTNRTNMLYWRDLRIQ